MAQDHVKTPSEGHASPPGSLATYSIGFAASIILTLLAYFSVTLKWLSGSGLMYGIMALAVLQLLVQLYFFLHLNHEERPRWNQLALSFMVVIMVILVAGTLWIMHHLNYNMAPNDTDTYIIQDEGYQQK